MSDFSAIIRCEVLHNAAQNDWAAACYERGVSGETDTIPYTCNLQRYPKTYAGWQSISGTEMLARDWLNLLDTCNGAACIDWANMPSDSTDGTPDNLYWGDYSDYKVCAYIDLCVYVSDWGEVEIWPDNGYHTDFDPDDPSERTFVSILHLLENNPEY